MPDNRDFVASVATYKAATKKVTFSGDADADLQLVEFVGTTGAEDSRTVVHLVDTTAAAMRILPVDPTGAAVGAASRTTDSASVAIDSSLMMLGLTAVVPKFQAIAAATSGSNVLHALVAAKKIRVLQLFLKGGIAGDIYFLSSTTSVIFGGATNKIQLSASQGFVLPFSPAGWFETVAGESLTMNASSVGPFSGGFTYLEV